MATRKTASVKDGTAKKATFKPGKGKSWTEKVEDERQPQVKRIEKSFADIPAGSKMLIVTPKIVDNYLRHIPNGKAVTLQTMRSDLAQEYQADYTCPVTSGIFLRIVSEAAHEQIEQGKSVSAVAPFWRLVDENSPLAKKLSFGSGFIKLQRSKEGIALLAKKKRVK
jgi:hypothetical protein